MILNSLIGFALLSYKLEFDGMYRRAGARPRHWVPVLNGCHSTKISKIDTF